MRTAKNTSSPKNVTRDSRHAQKSRRLIGIGLAAASVSIVGIVLLSASRQDSGVTVAIEDAPSTTYDPYTQTETVGTVAAVTPWEELSTEEQEAFIEEISFTEDEVFTEESWNAALDDHCSDGHCDADHLAQSHPDGQVEETVEEVVETTVPATTVPVVTETTMPTTETTAPAPTTTVAPAPTTTVAPAPTTTVAPADPVEDCIADQGICLTHAALAYMDDNWPLMPSGVNPPPYFMFLPGLWDGLCHRSECTYLNGERVYLWRLSDPLSFEDFASFADVWCPGVAGGEGTDSYGAACNTGHVSGGDYRINYNEGVLRVKWDNSNINPPAGFTTWGDWYRNEGYKNY